MVIPQTQDKDHAVGHGIAHLGEATLLREDVIVTESLLLVRAEVGGDGVARDTVDVRSSVSNDLAVLDIEALDLRKGSRVGTVISDELGHHRHLLGGVDDLVRAEVRLVAHTEGVEVTAVRVAVSSIALARVGSATVVSIAHGLFEVAARVGRDSRGNLVGLPDIQLGAARAMVASAGVLIIFLGLPAFDVALV